MATVRVEKIKDYTTLSNRALDDERLSLKAVGLLTFMLRYPDDWDFTLEWLAKKHKDGLSSIRSAMTELEAAGYVTRGNQRRSEGGTFKGSDYVVWESPEAACENRTRSEDENAPCLSKTDTSDLITACENQTRSACENPISVFPTSENRTQPNTIVPRTKETNTPPKAPQGAAWDPEMFERFWALYPKKKDKAKAIREWNRLKADRKLMGVMSAALKAQMASDEWQRDNGRAVPYPCRWLSHRRWEDETAVTLPSAAPAEEAIVWL